jgi:hypothetical protein
LKIFIEESFLGNQLWNQSGTKGRAGRNLKKETQNPLLENYISDVQEMNP